MEKASLVTSSPNLFEVPHVKLSLKGLVLGLIEEYWEDRIDEKFGFVDLESPASSRPRDDVLEAFLLNVVHQNRAVFLGIELPHLRLSQQISSYPFGTVV